MEQTITGIRKLEASARQHSDRCVQSELETHKRLPLSPVFAGTKVYEKDRIGQRRGYADNTVVADPTMVPGSAGTSSRKTVIVATVSNPVDGAKGRSTSDDAISKFRVNRLEVVREQLQTRGISEQSIKLLVGGHRDSTKRSYNYAWQKWHRWMLSRDKDPLHPTINQVLDYLCYLHTLGLSHRTINLARSAISSTAYSVEGVKIGKHELVCQLMKGIYNISPPAPKYDLFWDVEKVLTFLASLGENESLNLKQLSLKTAMLLALESLCRSSEIANIDRTSIRSHISSIKFNLLKPRKAQFGSGLEVISLNRKQDTRLCPVACLERYVTSTCALWNSNEGNHLFISWKKPHKPIHASTIGKWLKNVLAMAGIDVTKFSGHFTRGAAASRASRAGVPIDAILRLGSWRSRRTFQNYYNKSLVGIKL